MANTPDAPGKSPGQSPGSEPRLESWGEIASYLKRDIRTVQRWEKEADLPVHRLVIGKQGQVWALRSELDAWYLNRRPKHETEDSSEVEAPPNSDQLDKNAQQDEKLLPVPRPNTTPRFLSSPWKVVVAAAILATVFVSFLYHLPELAKWISSSQSKVLMYVRPFVNDSGDPHDKVFVTGLTDQLITTLGALDPDRLGVFAPGTTKEMGEKPIEEIRRQLNAGYVLEGSVQRVNDQVRIYVALVTTGDKVQIWSNSYTGEIRDILKLQEKVAIDVAARVLIALPKQSRNDREAAKNTSIDPRVYGAYIEGHTYWLDRDLFRSRDKYKEALAIDPNYAPALAGLAMSYLLLGEAPNDALLPEIAIPLARQAAQKSLALDPKIADAYTVLGNIAQSYDYNFPEAERMYKKAIEVEPNNVTAHEWYGDYLMLTNQNAAAEKEFNRALEIDPASPLIAAVGAEFKYYQRDYDAAIDRANQTLERHPGFMYAQVWLAASLREKKQYPQSIEIFRRAAQQSNNNPALLAQYGHVLGISGDKAGARLVLKQLHDTAQSRYVPSLYFAGIHLGMGELDESFRWLNKAYQERHDRLVYLGREPMADPLRSDPRFKELMNKLGLP